MLAKEVIEDSLLPFMTHEAPNVETYGEPISQKVRMGFIFWLHICILF